MVRLANNNDFNKDSRHILMKIDIYLDGDDQPPLVVDQENYLISATILEETGADSAWPLGDVSANELSFQMYSHHGLFCPTNVESPYYGKIKARVKVRPYFKPADEDVEEWIPMGVFYVSDWTASITGIIANVVAQDIFREIFKEGVLNIPIKRDTTYKAFYEDIFSYLGVPCIVSEHFNRPLPWAFVQSSTSQTIQALAAGGLASCVSNRDGIVEVKYLTGDDALKDTLTDMNQIKDASTNQSVSQDFDGIRLTYNIPQLVSGETLLSINDLTIPSGTHVHDEMVFTGGMMYLIEYVALSTDQEDVTITDNRASSRSIVLTTFNGSGQIIKGRLEIVGQSLTEVKMTLGDGGADALKVSNPYIQDGIRAGEYSQLLQRFVDNTMPTVDLEIRGNPLIQVTDQVKVTSDRFRLDYTGRVKNLFFKYDGSLEARIKLLNASLFEGGIL